MFELSNLLAKYPGLKDVYAELEGKRKELKDRFDAATNADGELDMSKVGLTTEEVRTRNDELGELKAAFEAKRQEAIALEHASEYGAVSPATAMLPAERRTIGDLWVASDAFKGFKGNSGPSAVLDLDVRNALFETGAGWAPEVTRTGRLEEFATRPAPHVVQFIPQTSTGQAAVKYMEETTFTNTAAETAEGGLYPEATLALTEKSQSVEKVSVWLPVTDEQFEDEERSRGYVNNRLGFMLRQRIDSQVLVGNGVAPNLLGTENVVGINSQALGVDTIPDAIHKGMTLIRTLGFAEPTVVFVQPAKWETVRLAKDTTGQYIWGHPSIQGPMTIWGIPVVETMAVTATKAVLGDYVGFSELAARRGIEVQATNAHSDFFVNGKLAIRADVRLAMVHYRPKAFAAVTGL